jgi:hypothetical protein
MCAGPWWAANEVQKVRGCQQAQPRLHRGGALLIPKKSGDQVKTNRRDAVDLAELSRAGELWSH